MGIFKIDVDQFKWINGMKDDPYDLCLHGHVMVQVGIHFFEDVGTVSATALYLLKSLKEDKIMSRYDIQMIPCCGHFLIANADLTEVTISGCDIGTDWSILHNDGGIKIVLPSGVEEQVDFSDYKMEVFRFADKVEAYYKSCQPKIIPEDNFSKNGYEAFWNEWHKRRNEQKDII